MGFLSQQAENGLQSRSSENGKTAVCHCGLILHGFGMIWYGLVRFGKVWYGMEWFAIVLYG